EKCFVTQSTLSTMINKLEREVGVRIFNRKTKPVTVTSEGQQLIERMRIIMNEVDLLKNVIQEIKGEMVGKFTIGVIPTVAPYLLPLFLERFAIAFPKVLIKVKEMPTATIQKEISARNIDIGILALPLNQKDLKEISMYEEPFLLYDCSEDEKPEEVAINELEFERLSLLEEGHCLRTQVHEICKISEEARAKNVNYQFESGSMESLVRITQSRKGMTVLPYLAVDSLQPDQQKNLVNFSAPVPSRDIGIVTHQYFAKQVLLQGLVQYIQQGIQDLLPQVSESQIIPPLSDSI
ncbi:MAG: LysR substrate-binding domain-containing protein, partial [Bacteroidota bacterium]